MFTKVLKKKEVEVGFIYIPVEKRVELLQGLTPPFTTKLNDSPAKWDNKGRLRCAKFLKNRFPVNAEVILTTSGNGFEVKLNEQDQPSSSFWLFAQFGHQLRDRYGEQ
jgi:hypothetical protein